VSVIDPIIDWSLFTSLLHSAEGSPNRHEIFTNLVETYGRNAGVVRECRMGIAYLFYQLGLDARSAQDLERSHNLNQLAMAMVWDVSRTHIKCMERNRIFGVFWLTEFMDNYLNLAHSMKRNEISPVSDVSASPITAGRIAIATVCDYNDPTHVLHGIGKISQENRRQYAERHGYVSIFKSVNEDAPLRHPVWTAIALPLRLLRSGDFDYVMWMDCDAMFIRQEIRIENLLNADPGKDLYISEDGRGLSGGNWIAKRSIWTINLLSSIYESPVFDQYDLKDQFGLLWSLLRSSVTALYDGQNISKLGYPANVGLVPQRLINAYPWALCRPSHHCFEDGEDFIVSFITLGSQSREMAWNLLFNFFYRN